MKKKLYRSRLTSSRNSSDCYRNPYLNRIKKYFRSHLATVISPRLGYNLLKCVFYADYNKAW